MSDNVIPLTRGTTQPTEGMNERLEQARLARQSALGATIHAHDRYTDVLAVERAVSQREKREAKVIAAMAAIDAELDYLDRVEGNHRVSRRPVDMWMMDETDEARRAAKDAYYAGLQNGEVIERWFDRPSIVAPLLLVMASFMLACFVIVLIAGGS